MNEQYRYCFEIHSANRRPYVLQAEGPEEQRSWVAAIRGVIERQLQNAMSANAGVNAGGGGSPGGTPSVSRIRQPRVQRLLAANGHRCADCNGPLGESPWASINVGVLLCIDCSGVHRSAPEGCAGFSLIFHEKSWIFMISQCFGGNLGRISSTPPKLCASLLFTTAQALTWTFSTRCLRKRGTTNIYNFTAWRYIRLQLM